MFERIEVSRDEALGMFEVRGHCAALPGRCIGACRMAGLCLTALRCLMVYRFGRRGSLAPHSGIASLPIRPVVFELHAGLHAVACPALPHPPQENKFKCEIISELPQEAVISCYKCGPMVSGRGALLLVWRWPAARGS